MEPEVYWRSARSFLKRVKELQTARVECWIRSFHFSAIDLFEEKTLTWYRSVQSRCQNWQELSELLTRHYLPHIINTGCLAIF